MRIVMVLVAFTVIGLGLFIVNFDNLVMNAIEKNPDKLTEIIDNYYEEQKIESEKQKIREFARKPLLINTDGAPVEGKANAQYKFVVFTDIQCPYCKKVEEIIDELKAEHGDEIQIYYKHLPLPFHSEAKASAKATWAAQQQGKFFEYLDILFDNQKTLGKDLYISTAKDLGLNIQKFKLDMASEKAESAIESDIKEARAYGFSGTPVVVVNGIPVKGAYPPDYFEMVFEVLEESSN